MMRGVIVAFAIVLVWTRACEVGRASGPLLVGPALVLQSAHTLTDVVGGALVGLILRRADAVAVRPARAVAAVTPADAWRRCSTRLERGELGDPLAGRRLPRRAAGRAAGGRAERGAAPRDAPARCGRRSAPRARRRRPRRQGARGRSAHRGAAGRSSRPASTSSRVARARPARACARPCSSSRRTSISPGGSSRSACSPRSSDELPRTG